MTRDEAAALFPLAEATVSDVAEVAGAPRVLADADSGRWPEYMLRPAAAAPAEVGDGGGGRAAASDGDAVVPGSALSRLLELAAVGPGDAPPRRPPKAPATRDEAEKRCRRALGELAAVGLVDRPHGHDAVLREEAARQLGGGTVRVRGRG